MPGGINARDVAAAGATAVATRRSNRTGPSVGDVSGFVRFATPGTRRSPREGRIRKVIIAYYNPIIRYRRVTKGEWMSSLRSRLRSSRRRRRTFRPLSVFDARRTRERFADRTVDVSGGGEGRMQSSLSLSTPELQRDLARVRRQRARLLCETYLDRRVRRTTSRGQSRYGTDESSETTSIGAVRSASPWPGRRGRGRDCCRSTGPSTPIH